MNAVRRFLFRATASIAALILIANSVLVSVAAQEGEQSSIPLGLEISATLKEIIMQHRETISTHIMEIKLMTSRNDESRLQLINQYHQQLRQRIQLMNRDRDQLLSMLRNGTISPQEFTLEMRRLRVESHGLKLLSDRIGYRLGELGKHLSQNLSLEAEELVEANKYFSEQMKEIHEQIKEELNIGMYRGGLTNLTDCNRLREISNMLSKSISRLEDFKERLSDRIQELRQNISMINESLQQASPLSSQCLELLNNLTARLNRLEDEIFNLNMSRAESLKKLDQLNEELNQHVMKREQIQMRIDELENQYQRMNTERKELENNLNSGKNGERERQRIRERIQELLREMEKINEERRECNELMNEVRNRIEDRLKAIEELRNATQRFMEEIRTRIREREKLLEMIKEIKEKCSREDKAIIKKYITMSLLEKKLEFLEKEYQRIETKIEILSNWLNEVNEKISKNCQQSIGEESETPSYS